jgi:serine/threonine-protein kinase HipA
VKKLDVYLTVDASCRRLVGQLAESDHRTYFEYDADFLRAPIWLSPFKLPPEPGLHEHRDRTFGPLFGLFDDSLPDGWGRLLMDRHFRQSGQPPEMVSPLERLAYLGTRTMGALTYHPPVVRDEVSALKMDLHTMASESYRVLEGSERDVLPELLRVGGSPGGARPKVLVGIRDGAMISGVDDLPAGYTGWLVKFPSRRDDVEAGRVEYAFSLMARAAGIELPSVRLFETGQGDAFFGVERFDRVGNQRLHTHTFGNLIHANFRIPSCDYEQLLRVARVLTENHGDTVAAFRLMVFNIMAHNRDDHAKNFAFMIDQQGAWRLTPAYDLTFSFGPSGEHSMTVAGEGREPGLDQIRRLGEGAGLSRREVAEVIGEVGTSVARWDVHASLAGLTKGLTHRIGKRIQSCLRRC